MPSPVMKIAQINNLSFPEAIKFVIQGRRITKKEWNNPNTYVVKANGFLCIHNDPEPKEQLHALLVSDGDLLGEDWYVLP